VCRAGSNVSISFSDTINTEKITEKDPATALILCVFLGPLGVHRLYLGTSVITIVAYVGTGAGFGTLWILDTIVLIRATFLKRLNGYSNNRNFIILTPSKNRS